MKPYRSALLIWQAANIECPNKMNCLLCENDAFCEAMINAYKEARKILSKEMLASLDEERKQKLINKEGENNV